MTGSLGSPDDPIANLFHHFRNPLSVIVGYAEIVADRSDEATRAEASERILEATRELSALIDDVVIVFAVDVGGLELQLAPTDLGPVVAEAVEQVRAMRSEYAFRTQVAGVGVTWPTVDADPEQLGRIVVDLLQNACRRAEGGTEISVTVERGDDSVTIAVADGGPPLSDEERSTAFARLASVSLPGRPDRRATGLELYKVRRLAELHGGTASADNAPGGGAVFSVAIPRVAPD